MQDNHEENFRRELGLLDGVMLVVGSMIGSGIFIVSSDMVRQVGSGWWLLALWILTGVFTVMAAVSYGELSAMFPKAGGQYVYLKEAYGKLWAFLYGWSFFGVVQTGTIAAVGVAFSKFASYLIPGISDENILFDAGWFSINAAQLVAILTIVLLTWHNSQGVKNSKILQTVLTIIKIASLLGLIVFGIILAADSQIWSQNFDMGWQMRSLDTSTGEWMPVAGIAIFGAISAALVGSIFSSDAWNGVTFISGEIKNPKRNVGLSLLFGTLIVSVLYVLANIMYLSVLPIMDIATAKADRVAVAASNPIFGSMGAQIIAVMIVISTFACNNGLIMAGARVYYMMGKDGLFFKKAAELNKHQVPSWSLWAQAFWASILCLTGKYGQLLDFVVIIVLIFYIMTIYGIIRLRKTQPDTPRPYKAMGYPFLPILYIIIAAAICLSLLWFRTSTCGWGVLILLSGIPVYYYKLKN